jgi:hypothetical protein
VGHITVSWWPYWSTLWDSNPSSSIRTTNLPACYWEWSMLQYGSNKCDGIRTQTWSPIHTYSTLQGLSCNSVHRASDYTTQPVQYSCRSITQSTPYWNTLSRLPHRTMPLWPHARLDNVLQYGESMLLLPGSMQYVAIGWSPIFAHASHLTTPFQDLHLSGTDTLNTHV